MIISVASGKGGTGKTLVATSLALSLKDACEVQLLDCDVEEPDTSIFLKPDISRREPIYLCVPVVDEKRCTYCGRCAEVCAYNAIIVIKGHILIFPSLCHACGACSYFCPEGIISEEKREVGVIESGLSGDISYVEGRLNIGEAMPVPVIREVKNRTDKNKTVIIDAPPGTSCPVVQSVIGSDFCLLVTEPTPFGLNDLIMAVELTREIGVARGVIINRDGTGNTEVEEYCERENIPVLMKIPMDMAIARYYSRGIPLIEGIPEWGKQFCNLFQKIEELVVEGNHSLKR